MLNIFGNLSRDLISQISNWVSLWNSMDLDRQWWLGFEAAFSNNEDASFHSRLYSDYRIVRILVRLDTLKVWLTGYWKFNTFLLDEKDFMSQLELILKRELTGAVLRNSWCEKLKSKICSFSANLGRRLNLEKIAAQRDLESKIERPVQRGNKSESDLRGFQTFFVWVFLFIVSKSKVSDHSRGWPEGSLFDSYYTKV